jgi:hypothetical protein
MAAGCGCGGRGLRRRVHGHVHGWIWMAGSWLRSCACRILALSQGIVGLGQIYSAPEWIFLLDFLWKTWQIGALAWKMHVFSSQEAVRPVIK